MLTEQKHHTMRNATMSCLGTMWVLALLLLCGCSRTSEFRARLMALDSVLVDHPDSVYDVMVKMEAEAHGQSQADRMYYELLRADAQNKAYVDFTTDSVMAEVADWYDRHGTTNEQMRAHYLLGCTYRDLGDVPMELQCFLDATTKADTASKDCDLYTLAAIYGQMANIYYYQYLPEEELKALSMCEKIAYMDKDTLSAIKSYELKIRAYFNLYNKDSVLTITDSVFKLYTRIGENEMAANMLIPSVSALIDKGSYDQAEYNINFFEKFYLTQKTEWTNIDTLYYHDKGRLMLHKEKYDSARICFDNLMRAGHYEAAYDGYVSLYNKLHKPDSVYKYTQLFIEENNHNFRDKNSQLIERLTTTYNYAHQMHIADVATKKEMEAKSHIHTLVYWLTCASLVIVILTLLYLYQHREHKRKRHEQKLAALNRYRRLQEKLILAEKEKQDLICKQKCLLESYKQQSDVTKADYEAALSDLHDQILDLQQEINALRESNKDIDFDSRIASFIDVDIVKDFKDITYNIKPGKKCTPTKVEWKALQEHFSKEASSFTKTMMNNYFITEHELQTIMLTILGFSNNEIAMLCEKKPQSISNTKIRIMHKLSIEGTGTRDFRLCIINLMKNLMSNKC